MPRLTHGRSTRASAVTLALAAWALGGAAQGQQNAPLQQTAPPQQTAPTQQIPRPDQLEPQVSTSPAAEPTAPAPTGAAIAADAPAPASTTPGTASPGPAGADAASRGSKAKGAGTPAPKAAAPKGPDRLELGTTDITGNRELPKVLYIVPWKQSDLGDLVGKPVNSLLDEVLQPIDRDVFQRENRYYEGLKPGQSAPRGTAAPGAENKP